MYETGYLTGKAIGMFVQGVEAILVRRKIYLLVGDTLTLWGWRFFFFKNLGSFLFWMDMLVECWICLWGFLHRHGLGC